MISELIGLVELLPDIPRWYTGVAEWAAAVVYILLTRPRVSQTRRYVWVAAALPVFIALQEFAGQLPLALWTFGMTAAVFAMFAFIYLTCDISIVDAGYLTARGFVLAELVASLQWQLWVHWTPRTPSLALGAANFVASIALLVVAYGIAFFAAYRLERRNFPRPYYLGIDSSTLVVSVAIGLATFLVSNLSFLTPSTPFSGQAGMDIFYIRTLVDLAGFVALYAQQSHRIAFTTISSITSTRSATRSPLTAARNICFSWKTACAAMSQRSKRGTTCSTSFWVRRWNAACKKTSR